MSAQPESGVRSIEGSREQALVSVIIPVRNGAATLAHTLRSVLSQNYGNKEIVVVDDGSTDGSAEIARSFPGVRTIRFEQSRGTAQSRNDGLAACRGEWIAPLDCDDWWPPEFLTAAMEQAVSGVAIAYDNAMTAAAAGEEETTATAARVYQYWSYDYVHTANVHLLFEKMPMLKLILERSACEAVGGYDETILCMEDFHFLMRLIFSGVRVHFVRHPFGFYRVSGTSKTGRAAASRRKDTRYRILVDQSWVKIYSSLLGHGQIPRAAVPRMKRLLCFWNYRLAVAIVNALRQGRWTAATRALTWSCVEGTIRHLVSAGTGRAWKMLSPFGRGLKDARGESSTVS